MDFSLWIVTIEVLLLLFGLTYNSSIEMHVYQKWCRMDGIAWWEMADQSSETECYSPRLMPCQDIPIAGTKTGVKYFYKEP